MRRDGCVVGCRASCRIDVAVDLELDFAHSCSVQRPAAQGTSLAGWLITDETKAGHVTF
jgi:hypothetical protein